MTLLDTADTSPVGTETATGEGTSTSAPDSSASAPSIDWEAARSHPEFKTHVKTYLEGDEEFRKEASRGVRMTDVEKRASERAAELAAADRQRAIELQARLDAVEKLQEEARLSTMTYDEQEQYKLTRRAEDAERALAEYRSKDALREAESAREDIIGYARREWGLDEESAEELRASKDGTDLLDRALKAANKLRGKERAELDKLRTTAQAQGRVLDGTSAFAATGNASAGGELSADEIRDMYRSTGTSSPQYERVRALYKKVYDQYGY